MATIAEAYVSFEVAKLLKEKGFPQDPYMCNTAYTMRGKLSNNAKSFISPCNVIGLTRSYAIAPTQQMAMRWLREEHNISIEISSCCKIANCEPVDLGWAARKIDLTKMVGSAFLIGRYDTYEMACEAAIKYCLENLNLI